MSHTKPFYAILNLPSPSATTTSAQTPSISAPQIRAQYRAALLAAHPDKHTETTRGKWSVDDVKEAFAVLSDTHRKREYDLWLRTHASASEKAEKRDEDFILGLEILDLSDFTEVEVLRQEGDRVSTPGSNTNGSSPSGHTGEGEEALEWRRSCRCGHDTGFRIREEELEEAAGRGEKEVLVGCEGCSLWVRVGFEVEEDG